jgi:hypothetical protein
MSPEKAAESIRLKAPRFGQAKGRRTYLEEFRRVQKAILMKDALTKGIEAANAQEREALCDPDYKKLLEDIRDAVEIEETLKWELESHRLDIEIFRTRQASERLQIRSHE